MLQNIFYLLAIIYLSLGIIILIVVGVAIVYIMKTVSDIKKTVDKKIKMVESFTSNPNTLFKGLGKVIVDNFIWGIKRVLRKTT